MFSLFNLQGTRPRISSFGFSWAPHSADLHFITRFSLCQELFCSFFNRFLSKPPRDQRSVILADHSFLVKHFFQILFISLSFLLILTLSLLFSCRLCLNLVRYDCYILYNIFLFHKTEEVSVLPIKIPDSLPARAVLEGERIFVMTEFRALHQDIRPLKVLILNLMPTKIVTEIQLMRKLSNTPLQIDVDLLQTATYSSRHTDMAYLDSFYKTFDQIKQLRYDGMIITGAPVENRDFEEVDYWQELCEIFEWTKTHVYTTLHICWGAQAGLYYHYHINKYQLPKKLSGIFRHRVLDSTNPLFRGFDDYFFAPHSRWTEVLEADILKEPALHLLANSEEAGVFAVESTDGRQVYLFGHPEYDANTLKDEYLRDRDAGKRPTMPKHYFPHNDPQLQPIVSWRGAGQLLYSNWLNYYVYQATPYDLRDLDQ